uniref:Replication-associated protein n=1 Tax=Cressdnaviricota sp. TaxID=2748378 RepID=A0A6M4B8X3_9VIRU|nr:replication-associated protein [Cressdnaviricota sp.]
MVIDKEVGSEGTPHLHLFLHLEKPEYLSYLKKVCERAHWEPVKNRGKCIEYCSKGEVVVSRLLEQPRKRQLSDAVQCLREQGMAGVARAYPEQFVLHARGLQALQQALLSGVPKPVPRVSWYWGTTGSGKTRAAMEGVNADNIYVIEQPPTKQGNLWFDGYCGQSRAVLDDYRPYWCSFSFLLRLLDRYDIQVPVKGGFVHFIPEEIIITTPKNIEDTFLNYRSEEDILQIKRRVHRVVHFVSLNRVEP